MTSALTEFQRKAGKLDDFGNLWFNEAIPDYEYTELSGERRSAAYEHFKKLLHGFSARIYQVSRKSTVAGGPGIQSLTKALTAAAEDRQLNLLDFRILPAPSVFESHPKEVYTQELAPLFDRSIDG